MYVMVLWDKLILKASAQDLQAVEATCAPGSCRLCLR